MAVDPRVIGTELPRTELTVEVEKPDPPRRKFSRRPEDGARCAQSRCRTVILSAPGIEVGTALPPLEVRAITRTPLALFAGASGDHNPIHVDIDVAKSVGLGDVFAHGMLSMAYLARMITNWVAPEDLRSFRVRFGAITPVSAQPTADGTVTLTGNAVVALN